VLGAGARASQPIRKLVWRCGNAQVEALDEVAPELHETQDDVGAFDAFGDDHKPEVKVPRPSEWGSQQRATLAAAGCPSG
jgi:hypothetical protein